MKMGCQYVSQLLLDVQSRNQRRKTEMSLGKYQRGEEKVSQEKLSRSKIVCKYQKQFFD